MAFNNCHVVEGLASLASRQAITKGTDPVASKANAWIERLMAQNRQLQIRSAVLPGLDQSTPPAARHRDFSGGFLHTTAPPRMRVDSTAHCLNALLIMDRAGMLERDR
jgi:L-fucose isomerase-like protein